MVKLCMQDVYLCNYTHAKYDVSRTINYCSSTMCSPYRETQCIAESNYIKNRPLSYGKLIAALHGVCVRILQQ